MKKLFVCSIFMTIITLFSCGRKEQSVPVELKNFTEDVEAVIAAKFDTYETPFEKIFMEENNTVVCQFEFDENEADMSMKQYFKKRSVSKREIADEFRKQVVRHCKAEDIDLLIEKKYNLLVRFVSSKSGDVMDCMISYKDMKKMCPPIEEIDTDITSGYDIYIIEDGDIIPGKN